VLVGGGGNDTLTGSNGDDTEDGGDGDDLMSGGGGNDTLSDGAGNDTVFGGPGNDLFILGTGTNFVSGDEDNDTFAFFNDTLAGGSGDRNNPTNLGSINGGEGDNTLNFGNLSSGIALTVDGTGTASLTLHAPQTLMALAGVQFGEGDYYYDYDHDNRNNFVNGTDYDDQIDYKDDHKGDANALLAAGVGVNLNGGGGNDSIIGSAADDTLDGGIGNDILFGGTGADFLTGGAGDDRFQFVFDPNSIATITDHDGADIIDLSAIDGNLVEDGHQALIVNPDGSGQVVIENGQIIITLITAESSGFAAAADMISEMRINDASGSYSYADIFAI